MLEVCSRLQGLQPVSLVAVFPDFLSQGLQWGLQLHMDRSFRYLTHTA